MIDNIKKILNLLSLIIGLALIARPAAAGGAISMTAGMVVGLAFTAYGAVRLYYLRGER